MSVAGLAGDDALPAAPPQPRQRSFSAHPARQPQAVLDEGVAGLVGPKAHTAGGLAAGRPMNERAEQRAGLGSQRQEHRLVSIEIPLVAAYPSSDGLELGVGRVDRVAPGIVVEVDTWEGQAV